MEPAKGPTPPPGPEEADVGAGLKPARAHTSRTAQGEVAPLGPTNRPPQANPHRRTRKEARPPPTASRRGRRRGGFQTRPRPHSRTAQGEVAPLGPTNRPPQAKPHRGTRKEARPPTPGPEEADVGAGFKPARARTSRTAQGEVVPPRSHQPPTTSQSPPWNPQGGPDPHAASRRGRRRGGFQTRPRPHQQNSPRRSRPPRSHQPPTTSQTPPWNPQGGPTPPPRPEEADVGAGFKPARAHTSRTAQGEVAPPSVPATAHHKPIPTVEPARRPDPPTASRRGRRRGGFQTRPAPAPAEQPKAKSPPDPTNRPPQAKPHRGTRKKARPLHRVPKRQT